MRYYKIIENGYITAIGTGGGGTEITEEEYNEIMALIHTKPPRTENKDYRLKEDLTWEAYYRPKDEESMKSTKNIPNGEYFSTDDRLFYSTATIAKGENIVVGQNCIETDIANALNDMKEN